MFFLVVSFFTPLLILGEGLCALVSSYLLSGVIRACSYDPNRVDEASEADPESGDEL